MYRARAMALLAAILAVLAVASGRNDEEYFRGQSNAISIVVATHNNARYITSALESVEESVELFIRERKEKGLSGVSVQIIIVDDNSSDDTALKVHRFVKHRKLVVAAESRAVGLGLFKSFSYHVPYPASSYFGQEVKYLVIELHTTSQRVGHGTLFNLGADYAIGEMFFFMDGGVMYHKEHVRECYNALLESTNAYVRTGFSFSKAEEEAFAQGAQFVERPVGSGKAFTRKELLAEQAAESVLRPSNLCVWRKVHYFVEGFPESSVWDDNIVELGNAYIASLGVGFPWSPVVPATVETIGSNAPAVASDLASAKALVRDRLIAAHLSHLNAKLAIYHKGLVPETMDPRWRIHSVALKSVGLEFVHLHKLDTRNSRLRSMLGLGQIYFASGDAVGTAAAYNVSRELVYPAKSAGNGGVVRTSTLGNWPISQHITIVQDPYRA